MSTSRFATDWNFPIGLPNCFPGARVGDALLELTVHDTQTTREDAPALPLHRALEHRDAAALAAQPVPDRDPAVLEDHFRHRRGAEPHLLQLPAHDESGVSRSTMKPVMPVAPRAGLTVA